MAAMVGLFSYVFTYWYNEVYFFYKGNFVLVFLYTFIYTVFANAYGGLKIGILRLRELVFSNSIAAFLSNFVIYFVMSLISYRMLKLWPLIICFFTQVALASFLYFITLRLHNLLYPAEDAVLVHGGDKQDEMLAEQFIRKSTRYKVKTVLIHKDFESMVETMEKYQVIIVSTVDTDMKNRLISYGFENNKQIFILPSMEDIMLNNASQYMAEDLIVYRCRNRAFTADQLAVKRLFDIALSLLIIVLTLPITVVTALAIKCYDGGTIFYKQARLTRNGKEFTLIKFRSMIPDAEKNTGAVLAKQKDTRITPVGRFIRACRIDELPQLWNVLKGDMSLVGPRPERPELFRKICAEYPQFAYRLKVKAGLTGYAQLYGKYNTEFIDKVRLDLLYIEKASLLQDLQLLVYTFKIIFLKESTQGISKEENSVTEDIDIREN